MTATCEYCYRTATLIGRDTGECVCTRCASSIFVEQASSRLTLRTAHMYGAAADVIAELTADAPVVVRLTPAESGVFDAELGGSENLDAAMDAGVRWTRATLTIPNTRAAMEALEAFIGQRAEIGADNLDTDPTADAGELAWWRAYVSLGRKFVKATGIRIDGMRATRADLDARFGSADVAVAPADVAADAPVRQDAPADTTDAYVAVQVAVWHASGALIHESIARAIAATWQESAYGNPYAAFASTGAIDDTLNDWLIRDIDVAAGTDKSEAMRLVALRAYVLAQDVDVWHVGSNVAGCLPDHDVAHTLSYADACSQYAERLMDAADYYSSRECDCDDDALCDMHATEACASAMIREDVPSRYFRGEPRELAHNILTDSHGRVEFWLTRERMTYASALEQYLTPGNAFTAPYNG